MELDGRGEKYRDFWECLRKNMNMSVPEATATVTPSSAAAFAYAPPVSGPAMLGSTHCESYVVI